MILENIIKTAAGVAILAYASPVAAEERPTAYIHDVDPAARVGVLGVNVLGNGLICGIVAAVAERPIMDDAGKCMAGGTIQYAGMEMGMHDVPVLPGIGLRVVETGTSIIDNTLAGREPFKILNYEVGPALFDIDTQGDFNWYWRALPIGGLIGNIAAGNTFSLEDTLSYQTFTFTTTQEGVDGYTFGNIMAYHPKWPFIRAHEFDHVLQYVRFRPAEQLVPTFLKDNTHLRIGEDIFTEIMNTPLLICSAADGEHCGRRWWNLTEVEAYIMETGNESYIDDFK